MTQENSSKAAEVQISALNEQIKQEKEKNVALVAKLNETVIHLNPKISQYLSLMCLKVILVL